MLKDDMMRMAYLIVVPKSLEMNKNGFGDSGGYCHLKN